MAAASPGGDEAWIGRLVSRLVLEAPENRLADRGGMPIFDQPIVGVADGDDALFQRLREVVDPGHMMPREVLGQHSRAESAPARVSVVAWALPFSRPIRRSNRVEGWPSRLYSQARNNGGALSFAVCRRLTEELWRRGFEAVAPVLTEQYDAFRTPPHLFSSSWSERHVAHIAGLGRFGLNGGLITPLSINVRIGSVVTSLPLKATARQYRGHRHPCRDLRDDGCDRCIQRCPVGAISRDGLDMLKCYSMRNAVRERHLESYVQSLDMRPAPVVKSGKNGMGYSLGCALCQCGVPCEGGAPEPGQQGGDFERSNRGVDHESG